MGETVRGSVLAGRLLAAAWLLALAGCGQIALKPSAAHVATESVVRPEGSIPAPVQVVPVLPPPAPTTRPETYSVVVNSVRVQDLLFALARDAKLNVDIHPGITGTVTLNAIDQTLPQLLGRISRQVDMRYEIDGQTLTVMRDTPYLRVYRIDYLNLARDSASQANLSTQVSGASPAARRQQQRTEQFDLDRQVDLGQQVLGNAGRQHQGPAARNRQDRAGDSQRRCAPPRPRAAAARRRTARPATRAAALPSHVSNSAKRPR
jgi:general secretion pathway protein D